MSESVTAPPAKPLPEKSHPSEEGMLFPGLRQVFVRYWPEPAAPHRWTLTAAAAVGLLAALLLADLERPGIALLICALAAGLPVALLAYTQGRAAERRWPVGRIAALLALLSIGLAAVSAVRASEWLASGCVLAAGCLAVAAVLDVRRLPAVLATLPLFGVAMLRAVPWAGRTVQLGNLRGPSRPWLTGLGLGLTCTLAVAALLASADDAFADVIAVLWPSFDPGLLPARAVIFLAAAGTVLGAMFAVSTRLTLPVWPGLPAGAQAPAVRHPAEWLTPMVLVAITIAAFLLVEATMLFGGADVVGQADSLSHAERAREGFGQLIVVTLIVLGLLAWSGRAAAGGPPAHRRLMGAFGGALLVLALLLGGSALRRLWLYQDAYGWTVTRVNAGAFELWVATVLIGVGVGWLLRRTDLLPRFLIGSAGLGLLVVAMAGPDALVASANVERFEQTGKIDLYYLSALSADAVPALDRLPEPQRSCALAEQEIVDDPWFGWNLSRARAEDLLRAGPVTPAAECA